MQRMLMQVIGKDKTHWEGSCSLVGYEGNWSELRSFSQEIVQGFSGSGSAGITPATGRIGMPDVAVEKTVDKMSPKIFENCCSGAGVDTVVIEVWDDDDQRMTLVLDGGVTFSGYKIAGGRYFAPPMDNVYNLDLPAMDAGGRVTGITRQVKAAYTVSTTESFTLVFTRVRLQVGTILVGWDGGKNCPNEGPLDVAGGPPIPTSPQPYSSRKFTAQEV